MIKESCKHRALQISLHAGTYRSLLLLDAAYKFIFCVFVLPLLSYGLDFVIKCWGKSYITAENVLSFLAFPPTILLLSLLLITITLMIFFEAITLIYFGSIQRSSNRPTMLHLMGIGFRKALRCITSGMLLLPFYTVLLFLFTSTTILIGITFYLPMNLTKGRSDEAFIKGLILLGIMFLCYITFRSIFTMHYCIIEHQGLRNAMLLSKHLLKGRCKRTAGHLLLYNLILTISFYLIYYIVLFATAILVYFLSDKSVVISVFLSIYPKMNFFLMLFFSMVAYTANINFITYLFHRYRSEEFDTIQPPVNNNPSHVLTKNSSPRKPYFLGSLLILLAAGLFNFYLSVCNDTFYLKDDLFGILVCSHRGNSHVAPENTISALENAIIARSDYAEIDLQQTKDGILVLHHDQNLRRTTGLNKNIWELAYAQLSSLDAGRWFGPEFVNTPIPTLEEAMIFCKGRIKLNIDIKASIYNQGIEEKLVELIEEYDYEHQCVISSWNDEVLVRIKELNPQIKTGYIMSVIYGDFYSKEHIDFFSIRSNFVSKYLVDKAHTLGKEVHAWTANSPNEIERLKSIGVDCIITDNPTLAREILYRNDSNKTFIELLNRMLYNRSFYRIQVRKG